MIQTLLANIPWGKLDAVNGPAPHIPQLILNLQSTDPDLRQNAMMGLLDVLWEQGSVYEATGHTIAPLLHLLKTPHFAGRQEVFELLFNFSYGTGPFKQHQHLSVIKDMYAPEVLAAKIAQETKNLAFIHAELLKGKDIFTAALNDSSETIRQRAKSILGRL